MDDSKLTDLKLLRRVPFPVAATWHQVALALDEQQRREALMRCVDASVRTAAAILISDYLGADPSEAIDERLLGLDQPALNDWMALVQELALHVGARRSMPAFVPELVTWARQSPETVAPLGDACDLAALQNGVRALMSNWDWMTRYRLFRARSIRLSREGGFRGKIQYFTGLDPAPLAIEAHWEARLFEHSIYLSNPAGDLFLETSPLLALHPYDEGGAERLFVFDGTLNAKLVRTREVASGALHETALDMDDRTVPWDVWLRERRQRPAWVDNPTGGAPFAYPHDAHREVLDERFEVRDLLGKGGMASVFLAWDRWKGAECALKVLDERLEDGIDFRQRFQREARTMKRLAHRYIMTVEESGALGDGRLYLKLPVLTGGTLADQVKAGPCNMRRVIRWMTQCLEALAHLHEQEIVHRDIKPSNFLLDDAGQAILADFGIALASTDTRLTASLEMLGSLAYMSPEQRRGLTAGPPSDIYGLGLVLHELATGSNGGLHPGRGVPAPLGPAIASMCASDPNDRPTARDLLAAIGRWHGPEGEEPVPEISGPQTVADAVATRRYASGSEWLGERQVTWSRPVAIAILPITAALRGVSERPTDDETEGAYVGASWWEAIECCNRLSERHGLEPAYVLGPYGPRKNYGLDAQGRMLYGRLDSQKIAMVLARFGKETMHVIQFEPQRLLDIDGIDAAEVADIKAGWNPDKYFVRSVAWDASGLGWRLPTEAEWLRARAHVETSMDLWEWVWDTDPNPKFAAAPAPVSSEPVTDPAGAKRGPRRLLLRGEARACGVPEEGRGDITFRLARTLAKV